MNDDREHFHEEEEILETVRRYESMKKKKARFFFDVYEFENIIDYYIDSNKANSAFEAAKLASEQHPSSIAIQLKKAQVLVDKGEPFQSLQILEKLEALESFNYEIFAMKGTALSLMGDIEGAQRSYDQALELNPDNREELLLEISQAFEHLGHFREAIRYLNLAEESDPENADVIYEIAFCYNKLNNLDRSIEYYKRYLDVEPYADNIWYNLGIVYNKG
ncbi:MAG: tetratricopeptide repeat protein, partial [Bacteroidales bacterium]